MPGLKIAVPTNAADAKRLLKTAIEDPNPVIFLEHKALYHDPFCKDNEPNDTDKLAFGKAKILQEGTDITVVAWGMMLKFAYELAQELKEEGISLEVIDLRTLVPYDEETILQSVKKTAKVIIAQEAYLPCGFSQEIGAMIGQKAFSYLDAPVQYIGAKHYPIPFAKDLENAILPQKEDLRKKIKELYEF
jgi:2-oxoisovalerate dehydrogenase E1 component